MHRVRISVRGLLVFVTAIVLFMGYSQYRRRTILRGAESLKQGGAEFLVESEWRDLLWHREPARANIPIQRVGRNFRMSSNWQLNAPENSGEKAEATASKVQALRRGLEELGVDEIYIIFADFTSPQHISTFMSPDYFLDHLQVRPAD